MIPNIHSFTRHCERYSWGREFPAFYLNCMKCKVSLSTYYSSRSPPPPSSNTFVEDVIRSSIQTIKVDPKSSLRLLSSKTSRSGSVNTVPRHGLQKPEPLDWTIFKSHVWEIKQVGNTEQHRKGIQGRKTGRDQEEGHRYLFGRSHVCARMNGRTDGRGGTSRAIKKLKLKLKSMIADCIECFLWVARKVLHGQRYSS